MNQKYRNKKVEYDGKRFDSVKEKNRYIQLKQLESEGAISDLQCQVKYTLLPSQSIQGKLVERALIYKADFVYKDNSTGETIVEDVKPTDKTGQVSKYYKSTAAYHTFVIKRKLMLWLYDIRVKEI